MISGNYYITLSTKLQGRSDLNLAAKVIYANLAFRMKLSENNGESFKGKRGYYVVYKVSDLAKALSVGKRTIMRGLRQLERVGLLFRKRQIHFTELYLPKLHSETYKSHVSAPVIRNHNQKQINKNVCVKRAHARKPKIRKSVRPVISEFRKHWRPSHKDVIELNQLSKDFSTKLTVEAVKIAHTRDFRTSPFNFISGVARRLKLENKPIKQTNRKRHRTYYHYYHKLVVKQPLPDWAKPGYKPDLHPTRGKLLAKCERIMKRLNQSRNKPLNS